MNIVFFARHFYPHIGGVEKHVLKIGKILVQKGHSVTVVTEKFDSKLKNEETYQKIKIYRIPIKKNEKKKKYEIWKYLKENIHIMKEADVVHVHDVFFWYLPFRFIFPRKKIFTTFHGYEGNSLPTRRAIVSHKMAETLSRGNICVGDYLKKWYGTKPDIVTYGAVDKSLVKSKKVSSKNKAVYIGRLEEEAGILDYLKLVKKLKDRGYTLELTVLGDGSQKKSAVKYSNKFKLPVKFLGFVKTTEDFLGDFDTVFTSRYLGTLEAMYFKKPVFCIYNNEIKKDYFTMSPFKNFIYHNEEIDWLLEMYIGSRKNLSLSKNKCERGYNWVKTQTWEKLTNQYLSLWKK